MGKPTTERWAVVDGNTMDTPTASATRNVVSRTLRQTMYLLVSWPIAAVSCLVVLVLAVIGIIVSPLVGGLVLLAGAGSVAGWAADLERSAQRVLLDRHIAPAPRPSAASTTWLGAARLQDRQAWLDLVWAILRFLVATLAAAMTAAWLGLVAGLPLTLAEILLPDLYPEHVFKFGAWQPDNAAHWAVQATIALAALALLPLLTGALTTVQAELGAALLGGQGDLAARVDELTASRAAARQAEAEQLRQLERDLHDGPQQRLVRLGFDLNRAERALSSDPAKAAALLAEARAMTTETLHELRDLSRRVAPPLLADRGLRTAITELASHSTIAVDVRVDPARLPAHVETAAYYVISEALANANKHSEASRIEIATLPTGAELVVIVQDDGRGGASSAKGHGLAGLEARLQGVDGRLEISSPAGGPTVVKAVIPCAS